MLGATLLPISLFWFAWTSQPSISYLSPIFAGVPFGVAQSTILQSLNAYIMDAYHIYSASALAATVVLRSVFACAFPLITPFMFDSLGDQWGMSIYAFLALACFPIPLLFFVSYVLKSCTFFILTARNFRNSGLEYETNQGSH